MSKLFSNKGKDNFMLIELANRQLNENLKMCLALISSMKSNSFNLAEYEARKKLLIEIIDLDPKFNRQEKLRVGGQEFKNKFKFKMIA